MLFGNLIHADHESQYSTNAFIVRILVNEAGRKRKHRHLPADRLRAKYV